MSDLNDLYFFVAVVRHGGFSAAARATGVEKTKLSRKISALEQKVGIRLLHRSTRKLALTDAGQQFFERSVPVVDGAQGAYDCLAELSREPVGTVRMSTSVTVAQTYLAPVLARFMAVYGKVRVVVHSSDKDSDLIEDQIDLALRVRPSAIDDHPGLVVREIGKGRRILVASPAYLAAHGSPAEPADLVHVPTLGIARDGMHHTVDWKLTHATRPAVNVTHTPVLLSNDLRFQLEATLQGVGIGLLPAPAIAGELAAGRLKQILPEWWGTEVTIYLIHPALKGMSPATRCLIDYLVKHMPPVVREHNEWARQATGAGH